MKNLRRATADFVISQISSSRTLICVWKI